jgi:hypothetical protein
MELSIPDQSFSCYTSMLHPANKRERNSEWKEHPGEKLEASSCLVCSGNERVAVRNRLVFLCSIATTDSHRGNDTL